MGAGLGGSVVDSAGVGAGLLTEGLFALLALLMAMGVRSRAGADADADARSMGAECGDGVH